MCERVAAVLIAAAWSCGGAREQVAREAPPFSCRGRTAGYVALHHLASDELGVTIECAQAGPRLTRWRTDKAGTHQEDTRPMTPGEFDKIWREIDATGWPNLRDCTNGTGGKRAPVYVFELADDQSRASFRCQSLSMPFPYNALVDPLDLAAQMGRGQLGDDEPPAAKDLDRKAKATDRKPKAGRK